MQPEKYAAFPAAYFSLSRLLISSGHLTLFSLSVPRLSFFTALFFYSWGTTLTILFSCPAFGTFLNFSMLSHNFLGFSGHLALFSLSVPRLSFFTALFFCSQGTTLTILFSCPAFWYFSQLFYASSQFSRFFGAPGSFSLSCAPFILFHCSLFLFLGHHTHNSLLMPRRMRNHNIVMIKEYLLLITHSNPVTVFAEMRNHMDSCKMYLFTVSFIYCFYESFKTFYSHWNNFCSGHRKSCSFCV